MSRSSPDYTDVRDNEAALRSPPRAQNLPLHADPRTLSTRRKPPSDPIHANTSVGAPLLGGAGGGDSTYQSTYSAACEGKLTHPVQEKRWLVGACLALWYCAC